MRILLLCKRHYTNRDLLGDRYGRLWHLPVELARLGDDVLVLAADYHSDRSAEVESGRATFRSEPLTPARPGRFVREALKAASTFGPDVVIASGDTPYGILGRRIARRRRVPFVFDVYDDYRAFRSAAIPGMERLFLSVATEADLVLVASRRLEGLGHQTLFVPNGVDTELFRPIDRGEARQQAAIGADETVVGYFGSLSSERGADVLVEAARSLAVGSAAPVRLLMAGVLEDDPNLTEDVVDYRGALPQSDLPTLINACNVVAVPYRSGPLVEFAGPSKLAEYLACGVPVVATAVGDNASVLGLPEGAVCPPDDAAALTAAIRFQLEHRVVTPLPDTLKWESIASELGARLPSL